jgi:hypothetical protein
LTTIPRWKNSSTLLPKANFDDYPEMEEFIHAIAKGVRLR